jgi:hypothetical protein
LHAILAQLPIRDAALSLCPVALLEVENVFIPAASREQINRCLSLVTAATLSLLIGNGATLS